MRADQRQLVVDREELVLGQQEQVLAREEQVVGDVKRDGSKPTVWTKQLTQEYYYAIAQKLKVEKNKIL
jgi:hypothetical protein